MNAWHWADSAVFVSGLHLVLLYSFDGACAAWPHMLLRLPSSCQPSRVILHSWRQVKAGYQACHTLAQA